MGSYRVESTFSFCIWLFHDGVLNQRGGWIQVAGEISKSRSHAKSRTQCENHHALVHSPPGSTVPSSSVSESRFLMCKREPEVLPGYTLETKVCLPATCPRRTCREPSEDQRWHEAPSRVPCCVSLHSLFFTPSALPSGSPLHCPFYRWRNHLLEVRTPVPSPSPELERAGPFAPGGLPLDSSR